MSLSSRFENIEMVQHLCSKLLEGRDVPEELRHWILMALREALANAIKHGNQQDLRSTSTSRWTSSPTRSRSRFATRGRASIRKRSPTPSRRKTD